MTRSIFLKKEEQTPRNKVLDFLITAQDFDYSLKDIAKYSSISYQCMKQLKKELVRNKWIILTRKVGRAQMYKLNLKSRKVKLFIGFYWSVIDEEVDKKLGIEGKSSSSGTAAVSVAAKSI